MLQDAAQFAAWGVQYLKLDSCGQYGNRTAWDEYALIASALRNASATPPYVELCEELPYNTSQYPNYPTYGEVAYTTGPWLAEGLPIDTIANTVLVEYTNMADNWAQMLSNFDAQFTLTGRMLTYNGITNHMDMLSLCMGGQSDDEYRTQMSLWSIMGSPLILGNDFQVTDPECASSIIANKDVIAVNQDDLVAPAQKVFDAGVAVGVSVAVPAAMLQDGDGDDLVLRGEPASVWWQVLLRPLAAGGYSVVIFCREGAGNASELLSQSLRCGDDESRYAVGLSAREQKGRAAVCEWLASESTTSDAGTGVAISLGTYSIHKQRVASPADAVTYSFNMALPLLGMSSSTTVRVTDLWAHSSNGTMTGSVPVVLAPHAVAHINVEAA